MKFSKALKTTSLGLLLSLSLVACNQGSTPEFRGSNAPPASSVTPSPEVSSPTQIRDANLTQLIANTGNIISNGKFRAALADFLATGKKPKGFDNEFRMIGDTVAKDGDWKKEKSIWVKRASKSDGIILSKDVDLHLSAIVFSEVINLNMLDSSENPVLQIDPKLLKEEGALLTWKQQGGLRVLDKNEVITAISNPSQKQFFIADGSKISSKNILSSVIAQNYNIDLYSVLDGLHLDVMSWVDANADAKKLEESTKMGQFQKDIFKNRELETGMTVELSGKLNDYLITVKFGDKIATINNLGDGNIEQEGTTFKLDHSPLSEAWDIYQTVFLLESESRTPTLEDLIEPLNKSESPKGGVYSVESIDDKQVLKLDVGGKTYKMYDLTKILG